MELVDNFVQFSVTLLGFCLSGMRYLKGRKQAYFLLTCFYGCFALGSLYWTLIVRNPPQRLPTAAAQVSAL